MNIDKLPEILTLDGENYIITEHQVSDDDKFIPGWWQIWYSKSDDDLPVEVSDGQHYYYLCSCDEDRERAREDMLERINTVKNVRRK